MFHHQAIAALRRGYHCLLFDGPGQGRPLIRQGLLMRPDWETVVRPVLDWLLAMPGVDPERVALVGWSFGGFLAPRAASGDRRLAALIADPGQCDLLDAARGSLRLPDSVRDRLPDVDDEELAPAWEQITGSPVARWLIEQRAMWVHGSASFGEYLRALADYTLSDRVDEIRCPTLITHAESDPIARFAGILHDALSGPKTLMRFTDAEGAGDHCEGRNRSHYHQRAFDWLDETLGYLGGRQLPSTPARKSPTTAK